MEGCKCGRGSGLGCAEDDNIVFGKSGSEVDVGRVPARLWVERVEVQMEGRRIRVGGATAAPTCEVVVVDGPEESDDGDEDSNGWSSLSFFCSFSFVFLELGLGGGLLTSSSSSWCSLLGMPPRSSLSKSKILAKFNPTLGEQLKRFTISA